MPTMRVPKVNLKFLKKFLSKRNNTNNVDSTATLETLEEEVTSPKSSKKQRAAAVPEPPPEECPICHDPVGLANPEGIVESWTSLYCGHKFGTHCIQTWLQESINRDQTASPSCPICRAIAKHPCGHLISPPLFSTIPFCNFNWMTAPPPSPPPRRHHHQTVRRRLTRRAGHPLRPQQPPQPQPPQRQAQTVGECKTCAENAAFDARIHKLRERQQQERLQQEQEQQEQERRQLRRQTGESSRSQAATAIKSIIPGLKRSAHTAVRTTVVHMGVDPHEREEAEGSRRAGHRHSRAICYGNTTQVSTRGDMARRPSPPPSYNSRRLSI